MYDATNEAHEFVADQHDEAVAKACEFFGVGADALEIRGFPPGDVYGLAGRCVVVAVPRDRKPPRDSGPREGGRGEGRGRSEARGRERGGRDRERGGRDRERGRGRGRDRERGGRDRDRDRGRDRDREPEPERLAPELEDVGPSKGTPRGTLTPIGEFLCGVVEHMGLGPFEISESAEDELVAVEISGVAAGNLAAGDGRPVDALQLLANQAAVRMSDDPVRVVVDVEGDAEARESRLQKLAHRVARRAADTGRAVALDPMNGSDRRFIHLALRDEEDVATMSIGEGRYRQVVVVPEGAPEYEEARRESAAAAERSDG